MRLSRLKLCFAVSTLLAFALPALAAPGVIDRPHELLLTILHTNDVHGHILPFYYQEIGRGEKDERIRGGAARRATLIRELKRSIKNPVLLVDGGDTFTRGPLTKTYLGVADTAVMNSIGYDIAELGNNEFKAKDGDQAGDFAGAQAAMLKNVRSSKFPWICANLRDANGGFIPGIEPFVVREIGGVRVGFLGLTTPVSNKYPQLKGWHILNPIQTVREWVPIARKECDVLIAITHDGVDLDRELAVNTSGIDAIIGAHSHTFLYKPIVEKNLDGQPVPIVQDGEFGVDLGRFDLDFKQDDQGKWTLASYKDRLIPIDDHIKEAGDIKAVADSYADPLLKPIGELPVDPGKTPAEELLSTKKVICDAMRYVTGAPYALTTDNGTLAKSEGLFDVFRSKTVSQYDIDALIPFHDSVVVVDLPGTKIKEFVKKSCVSGNLSEIDDAKIYPVAMIDFLALSDYGLAKSDFQDVKGAGIDICDAIKAYITKE
jgi:5'-nucleotidase